MAHTKLEEILKELIITPAEMEKLGDIELNSIDQILITLRANLEEHTISKYDYAALARADFYYRLAAIGYKERGQSTKLRRLLKVLKKLKLTNLILFIIHFF